MAIKDFLEMLPDVFKKEEKSNIGKLAFIFDDQTEKLKDLFKKIEEWRSIDVAKGQSLDELGANVGQNRGKANDEIYRVLIRGKVARNASDGTINKMVEALAISLNCKNSDITIINAKDSVSAEEREPAAIIVQKVPLAALNRVGITVNQFIQIAESIVSAGVRIMYVNLEGTFSFASKSEEIELSEFGFADVGMKTGGTLGSVFIPSDDYKLPL